MSITHDKKIKIYINGYSFCAPKSALQFHIYISIPSTWPEVAMQNTKKKNHRENNDQFLYLKKKDFKHFFFILFVGEGVWLLYIWLCTSV